MIRMNKKWFDKNGIEIKNGDIVTSPQGTNIPIVYVEEWDDLAALLTFLITPLSKSWEGYGLYEITGKGEPKTIKKDEIGKMEDMPEYKRDYGRSPEEVIKELLL